MQTAYYHPFDWRVMCNGNMDPMQYLGTQIARAVAFACYERPLTAEEISLKTGIPALYVEDELERLIEGDAVRKIGGKYAADFIRENYATAKISAVAGYIGIHRSYLTSIFKEKMGISPQEYLIQCKLQQAIALLIETNNPIQEIARKVGYDNPLTFSKTFKNFYGVSPKLYRQQHREADMNSEKNPKELPV